MLRTRGISPKVIGPFVSALSAFAVAKIDDGPTEALVVATIGTIAAVLLPPGDIQEGTNPNVVKRVAARRRNRKAKVGETP